MAMSKGVKIAIGCALAAVVLTGGVVVALFGVAWWAKGKVGEVVAEIAADIDSRAGAARQAKHHARPCLVFARVEEHAHGRRGEAASRVFEALIRGGRGDSRGDRG